METSNALYPCHINPTVPGEQFISDHIFIYLVSGTMTVYDENKEYLLEAGDYGFAKRNSLAKYLKKASANGNFKTVSIFFKQDFLKSFAKEYGYAAKHTPGNETIRKLAANSFFENYVQSLGPYQNLLGTERDQFLSLKNKEIIFILLKTNPELKNVLFDFSDPGKIDLESFMNRNFHFNISMDRFAYLTGRSLTSFKRDFEKLFHAAPGRWLLEKRLQEAHFLIDKKGQKPSSVYLEVGFEDLSHFSYAFKKAYGVAPSQLSNKPAKTDQELSYSH